MTYTYDTKCWELAILFLSDHPELDSGLHAKRLAWAIQTAVEDYLNDVDEPMPVKETHAQAKS